MPGLPSLGPPVADGESHSVAPLPPVIAKALTPASIESLPVPPPSKAVAKAEKTNQTKKEKKAREAELEVSKLGGAAAKLLPETV